jgi:hypothetical protein
MGQPRGKFHPSFTLIADNMRRAGQLFTGRWEERMAVIAIAMFIALFGLGSRYFGWSDPDGKVQLALAASFIFGIISGYRARG